MKELMNKVTEAKKAAEANAIFRREETAAIRSQANTAKLLANNPTRGQVLGSTTADGRYPSSRPVAVHEILSTMYHQLGVDPTGLLRDAQGRPTAILPEAKPIAELLG